MERVARARRVFGAPDVPFVLSIAGPTGVGKSTLVRRFAGRWPVYLELHHDNPFLPHVLSGARGDVVERSQRWFLEQAAEFVRGADPSRPAVLDQDPAAVVHVYAAEFLRQGRLDRAAYDRLRRDLAEIRSLFHSWAGGHRVVVLTAPPETLIDRVARRTRAESRTDRVKAPTGWIEALCDSFESFARRARAPTVSTGDGDPDAVYAEVTRLLGIA